MIFGGGMENGMEYSVLDRLTECFFTTREVRKGGSMSARNLLHQITARAGPDYGG